MAAHVSTDAGMIGLQGTASLRSTISAEKVMIWGAIAYARKTQLVHIPGNLSAARYRDEVLTPHILPAMNLRRGIFNTTTLGRTQLVLLLTLM